MANIEKKEKRVNQIIEAVIDCIAKDGYENLTMQHISQNSGLSKGAINHYFKSKEDILITVLKAIDNKLFAAVDKRVRNSPDIEGKLRFRLSTTFDEIKNDPGLIYAILSLGISNPAYGGSIRHFFKKIRRFSSGGVKLGLEKGAYKGVLPESIGVIILGVIVGVGVQWVLDEGSFDYDKAAKISEDMIICYLEQETKKVA